jgi:hypothetical protein
MIDDVHRDRDYTTVSPAPTFDAIDCNRASM